MVFLGCCTLHDKEIREKVTEHFKSFKNLLTYRRLQLYFGTCKISCTFVLFTSMWFILPSTGTFSPFGIVTGISLLETVLTSRMYDLCVMCYVHPESTIHSSSRLDLPAMLAVQGVSRCVVSLSRVKCFRNCLYCSFLRSPTKLLLTLHMLPPVFLFPVYFSPSTTLDSQFTWNIPLVCVSISVK